MQLYLIEWIFKNAEDQLFATNEFCEYLKEGKINYHMEGFDLVFIAHTPQDGTGIIICKAASIKIVFNLINMWRESYGISFNVKPAITSEELLELNSSKGFWAKE